MNRILLSLLLALAGFIPANAQYKFTIDGGFSGNCNGVNGVPQLNQQLQMLKGQVASGFPDKASCEQARALVNSIKAQAEMIIYDARTGKIIDRKTYNCSFSMSASPCTGRPLTTISNVENNIIQIGVPNVSGVSQGTSFYSTNFANEIQNWSEDEAMRRMGLDKSINSYEPTNVSTGDDEYDRARYSSLPVIDPDKPFVSVNLRDDNGDLAEPNEYYFGEVLGSNDERWANILEKESTKELYTEYTVSENGNYDEINFYADVVEDILHNFFDIAEVTGAVAGATTVAGAIGTAVLADFAVSLVVEDGVAAYKWFANNEIVSTKEIFKNTLNRASFGVTTLTKEGLEKALVGNNKLFSKAGSITLRTIHYGGKFLEKMDENE